MGGAGESGTSSVSVSLAFGRNGRISLMDKEHIKGSADKAKGAVKDAAGKMIGDKRLQAEGKMDKAKGAAHQTAGDVKDAIRQSDKP